MDFRTAALLSLTLLFPGLPALATDITEFEQALQHYRHADWTSAETMLQTLQHRDPDALLYALFLSRIAHFRLQPPPSNWNGVFTFDTK